MYTVYENKQEEVVSHILCSLSQQDFLNSRSFFVFHNPEWIFHPEIYLLYILSPSNILSPLGKESCSLIACLGKKSNSSARFKSTVNNLR